MFIPPMLRLLVTEPQMPRAFTDTKQLLAADLMMLRDIGSPNQGRRS